MRKPPIRHKVNSHTRKKGRIRVPSYMRGHGKLRLTVRKKRIKRYGRYFPERIFYEECRRLAKEHPKWSRTKIEAEATVRLLDLNSNPRDKEFDVHLVQLQKMKGIEIEPLQWVGVMVKARVWKDGKPLGIGYYDSHAITRMGFKFRGKLAEKLKLVKKKRNPPVRGRKTQTYYKRVLRGLKWVDEKHTYNVRPGKMKVDDFKKLIIKTLKEDHSWKDRQGAFYYPDFRFIIGQKIGFKLKEVDDMLGYALHKDIDFRARLWFPVAFGIKRKRDRPSEQLAIVLQEPFDTITLRY